ncbi:hypothetical protein [Streptomyces sp. NBC_00989]|uniref:hypothetical protein n=1 Tax=Streptomyces sp. NBC_00989 TaxID=2903705 RepID=UPI0038684A53|nr:hypothetical protein OG714_02885 [Streptomyces sp. NBC_00989]
MLHSTVEDHAGSASRKQILAGRHLVYWASSVVFLACGILTALMFRSGSLIVSDDAQPAAAR